MFPGRRIRSSEARLVIFEEAGVRLMVDQAQPRICLRREAKNDSSAGHAGTIECQHSLKAPQTARPGI